MDLNIGNTIANLRRQKGLTQEQLAQMVGVSTPAVSKWETGASYPDITLLSPVARALGTNVDTLLCFSPELSDDQAAAFAAELAAIAKKEGGLRALTRMRELLHTYPENPALLLHTASVLTQFPAEDEAQKQENRQKAKQMLTDVRKSGCARLFGSASYLLVRLNLEDNELKNAEDILNEIPSPYPDLRFMKAELYERQGKTQAAQRFVQTELYIAFQKMEACLEKLITYTCDTQEKLYICGVHRQIAEQMGYASMVSDRLFAEAYLLAGNEKLAAQSVLSLAKALCAWRESQSNPLFSQLPSDANQAEEMLRYLRGTIRGKIQADPRYESIRNYPEYLEAMRMLQN